MSDLDAKDLRIVELLLHDASTSNRDLARDLGIAESSTLERVRKLRRDGVLRGQHAEVDFKALGAPMQVMILVRLTSNARDTVESFRDAVLELPEARSVYLVTGAYDFLIHAVVRDPEHLRTLELDHITSLGVVDSVQTLLVFEHGMNWGLPVSAEESDSGGRRR
ncbi:MAG TPA: Lrp/AsnC family transcriptional regulator [Longimicrobiales bacterium]|nr:Lrp/AsnC family transcriptional regulator [Longimicrobiales bacterium]